MRVTRVAYAVEGWGVGELWLAGDRVVELTHPRPAGDPDQEQACELTERLGRYFAGEQDTFADVALELEDETPLGQRLAAALREVPYGETVTYGELAALAGSPGAARAAGSFCARNRFAIVVPCHRVVGSTGIGGYGSLGLAYKRRLLELERRVTLG